MMSYINLRVTSMRLFTTLLILCCLSVMPGMAQKDQENIQRAEIRERTTQLSMGVSTLEENSVMATDIYSTVENALCGYHCVRKAKIRVRLHANGDANLFRIYGQNVACSVTLDPVYVYTGIATTILTQKTLSINIDNTTFQNEAVTEFDVTGDHPKRCPYSYPSGRPGRDQYGIKVAAPIDLTNIPMGLRSLVKLEVTLIEELTDDPTKGGTSSTALLVPQPPSVSGNPVTLSWTMGTCADKFPMYVVQILRLYNQSASFSTDPVKCSTAVDWSRALTIPIYGHATSLTLTLAEGTGYYLWRVRPIGNFYPNYLGDSRNWGAWTAAATTTLNLSGATTSANVATASTGAPNSAFYYSQFDADKNWYFSRAYFEAKDGKPGIAESITYATELLQPVQAQRASASTGGVLVQQTILDHFNRPALSTMRAMKSTTPAPLAYVSAFARNVSTSQLYRALDFDSTNTTTSPNGMSGQARDYWSGSTDVDIPSPGNYPFSRTVYEPDPSGQVTEQSGPGPDHRIGSGHTTKTFSAAVADAELITIFGDEAPSDTAAVKIVSTDQNGVTSLTYRLKNGRTIATCLVDDGTTLNLHELNDKGNVNNVEMVDTIRGGVAKDPTTLLLQQEFTLLKDATTYFYYGLQANRYSDECQEICRTCDYTVELKVRKKSDNSIVHSYSGTINQASCPGSSTNDPKLQQNWTSVSLPKGSYKVERILTPKATVNGPAVEEYRKDLTTAFNTKVQDAMRTMFNGSTGTGYLEQYYNGDHLTNEAFLTQMLKKYSQYRSTHSTISLDACCEVALPEAACTTGCEEGFDYDDYAAYMVSKCSTSVWADSMRKSDGGTFSAAEMASPYAYFFLPNGDPLFGSTTEATTAIGALIGNLLANGYACDQVWACWANLMRFDVLQTVAMEKRTVSGDTRYRPRIGFSLLDYFIECLGPKYCGTVSLDDKTTGTTPWVANAWKVIPFNMNVPANAAEQKCLDDMGYNAADTSWNCALTQQAIDDVHENYAQLHACLKAARYGAIMQARADEYASQQSPSLSIPASCTTEVCLKEKILKMEAECTNSCEARYGLFRDSLVAMYLGAGYYVEGTSPYVTPTPTPNVTRFQIYCAARTLVDQCKEDCSLSPVTFDPMTNAMTWPDAAKLKRHHEAKTSQSFRLSIPQGGECPAEYRRVQKYIHVLEYMMDILNERLKAFRDGMTTEHATMDIKAVMSEPDIASLAACLGEVATFPIVVQKKVASRFVVRKQGGVCRLVYATDAIQENYERDTHILVTTLNNFLNSGWGKVIDNTQLTNYFTGVGVGGGGVTLTTNAVFDPVNYYSVWTHTNVMATTDFNDPLRPVTACPPNGLNITDSPGGILPMPGMYGNWTMCAMPLPCLNGLRMNMAAMPGLLRFYSMARTAFKYYPTAPESRVYGDAIIDICGLSYGYGFKVVLQPVTNIPIWTLEVRRGPVAPYILNVVAQSGETELLDLGIRGAGTIAFNTKYTDLYGYFRVENDQFQYVDHTIEAPDNITVIPCLRPQCVLIPPDSCNDIDICQTCAEIQCADVCFKWVAADTIQPKFRMKSKSCVRMAIDRLVEYFNQEFYGGCLQKTLKAAEISYNGACWNPKAVRDTVLVKRTEGYYHYTLYYYDRAGNLTKTVPPKGFVPLTGVNATRFNRPSHTMLSKYSYNSLGQTVKQSTPDGGVTEFWYDAAGRLRVSQNASQAGTKYTVTDYDDLGRVVLTGEVTASLPTTGQTLADATSPLSGTYLVGTAYSTASTLPTPYASLVPRFVQNRVSSTYTDEDGSAGTTDDRTTTYYSYDPHGNVEWVVHVLPGMTSPIRVEYEYDLITGKVVQMNYQRGYADQYFTRYSYDADLRVTEVRTSRDSVIWEKDAAYEYMPHGPLRRLEIGQEKVSGVDYAYTIHGWLKGLNHPSLESANDPGNDGGGGSDFPKDAFGMTLGYYDDDFVRSDGPYRSSDSWSHAVTGLYNGNIAGWIHSARDINGAPARGLAELYGYDRLNRLRADTGVNRATTPTAWDAKPAGLGAFGSSYEYDPNGNISKLKRSNAAGGDVDDLTYTLQNASQNKLDRVVDAVSAGTSSYANDIDNTQGVGNYVYDNIGNLVKDLDAGIGTSMVNGIEWTPHGKIRKITTATYRLEYLYNAVGSRIRQKRTKLSDNSVLTTYYGRDAAGEVVVATYEKVGTGATVLKEVPVYGSARLGLYRPDVNQSTTALTPPAVYERYLGRKDYELTDHLGNVRVAIGDRLIKPGADWRNDVTMQTDYFPFGMQREDRNDQVAGYRYGYNGKENDNDVKDEGNQQDYGFRIYDPRVARFLSVDPLTKDYPWYTPYQFAGNMPIQAIDLDGLEPFFVMGTGQHRDEGNGDAGDWTGNASLVKTVDRYATEVGGHDVKQSPVDRGFSWNSDESEYSNGFSNHEVGRGDAAKGLADYVIARHKEGEDITLIGYSHGGNVALQAVPLIRKVLGDEVRINIVTLSTPARTHSSWVSGEDKLSPEDPRAALGGNTHMVHFYNATGDGVVQLDIWNNFGRSDYSYDLKMPNLLQIPVTDGPAPGREDNAGHGWIYYQDLVTQSLKSFGKAREKQREEYNKAKKQ